MATLEYIQHTPHRCEVVQSEVTWTTAADLKPIEGLPQIFWSDLKPWTEANLWARERATSHEVSLQTVQANSLALHAYATWLEKTCTDWRNFPKRKADRCLVRYRGALIAARDEGQLAPSTASARMSVVVQFYRWLYTSGFVSSTTMWTERFIGIPITDAFGFLRTVQVRSTDLAIPNRKAAGVRLEGGLLPLSDADRDAVLAFTAKNASEELHLMLQIGFFSGMRIGTIADLKIETLDRAVQDPASATLFRITVGPGAHPPVHTKGGVTGTVNILGFLLEALRTYIYSTRRLKRQSIASEANSNVVFLTSRGNRYARHRVDKSSAINVEIHALRKRGTTNNIRALRNFHFHQSRATFATELARRAMSFAGPINAIALVREALLHKDEATSLKYIKFVETSKAKKLVSDQFTEAFMGVVNYSYSEEAKDD